MQKNKRNFGVLIFVVFFILFSSVYAADNDTDFNSTKTQVNQLQNADLGLPSGVPQPKGSIGDILAKMFGSDGKIGTRFLSIFAPGSSTINPIYISGATITGVNATTFGGQSPSYYLNANNITTGTFSGSLIPNATTTSAGKIQLAGDIGGTWNSVTINGNAITSAKILDATIATADLANFSVTGVKIGTGVIDSAKILNGTILDADISATAAIAGIKISPNFGAQNVVTTGQIRASQICTSGGTGCVSLPLTATSIDGGGTANYVARFTDGNTLGTGAIFDNGTSVGIGTNNPTEKLEVNGRLNLKSTIPTIFFTDDDTGADSYITADSNLGSLGIVADKNNEVVGSKIGFHVDNANSATPQMVITGSGDIGIGTASPTKKLHIYGNSPSMIRVERSINLNSSIEYDNSNNLPIYAGATADNNFSIDDDENLTTSPLLVVQRTGNVGIGVNSPIANLDIAGRVNINQGASNDIWIQGGNTITGGDSRNLAMLGVKASDMLRMNYLGEYAGGTRFDGNVGIGANPIARLHIQDSFGTGSLGVLSVSDLDFLTYDQGNDLEFGFVDTTGAITGRSMIIRNTGNVGIGAADPNEKLEVVGNIKTTGDIMASRICTSGGTGCVSLPLSATSINGGGTANYSARFTDADTLGTGSIFDNGTNIGIRTSTPVGLLHIDSITDASITSTGHALTIGPVNGVNLILDNNEILARNNGVTSSLYIQHDATASNTILNNTSGNVGIGTTTPTQKLDVVGNILASGTFIGNGSTLTNLNASNITSGTLTGAVLPNSVVLTSGDQTIAGNKTFSNDITVVGRVITDNLVNRTVSQLSVSGSLFPTLASSQKDLGATANRWANLWLSGNASVTGSVTAGTFVGNGASITAINPANISAGTAGINITGNAGTATALQTARTITLGGDVTGSASFNGGSNITITGALAPNSVVTVDILDANVTLAKLAPNSVDSGKIVDASIVNADVSATAAIAGTKIAPNFGTQNILTTGTIGGGAITGTSITGNSVSVNSGNITNTQENNWASHVAVTYSTPSPTQHSPFFIGLRARGTQASPTYPQMNDFLAAFGGRDAIDGVSNVTNFGGAAIYMNADENMTLTNKGTRITFLTTNTGAQLPTEKVRIASNGNVGIGTNNPTSKLQVVGNIVTNSGYIVIDGNGDSDYGYLTDGPGTGVGLAADASRVLNPDLYVNATGSVGIGTLSPSQKLDVTGNIRASGDIMASRICTSGGTGCVSLPLVATSIDGGGTANYVARFTDGNTLGTGIITDTGTGVGIGAVNPTQKLDVTGNIRATGTFIGDGSTITNINGNNLQVNTSIRYIGAKSSLVGPFAGVGGNGNTTSTATGAFSGIHSIFLGTNAGYSQTTGSNNTFIGQGAGYNTTIGNNNVFLGVNAGYNHVSGSDNFAVLSNLPSTTENFQINIMNKIVGRNGKIGLSDGDLLDPTAALHVRENSTGITGPTNGLLFLENTANPSPGFYWDNAHANIGLRTAGTGAGDPFIGYDINGEYGWSAGVDNSDVNKFKISGSSSNVATNTRLTIDTAGNVGIGNSAPAYNLDITGNLNTTGTVGFGTATPDVNVGVKVGISTVNGGKFASYMTNAVSGTFTAARTNYGGYSNATNTADNATFTSTVYGQFNESTHNSASISAGSRASFGAYNRSRNSNVGNLNTSYGSYNIALNDGGGDVATSFGTYGYSRVNNAASVITNSYGGYFASDIGTGSITNSYGVYIGTVAGTNPYGLYSATAADSYFAGNVGIGTNNVDTPLRVFKGGVSLPNVASGRKMRIGNVNALDFGEGGAGDMWIQSQTTNMASYVDLLINPMGGNVGIGVTSPTAKLHVNGNIIASTPTAANHVATKAYVDSIVNPTLTHFTLSAATLSLGTHDMCFITGFSMQQSGGGGTDSCRLTEASGVWTLTKATHIAGGICYSACADF